MKDYKNIVFYYIIILGDNMQEYFLELIKDKFNNLNFGENAI